MTSVGTSKVTCSIRSLAVWVFCGAAALSALTGANTAARADSPTDPFAIKVGLYLPSNTNTRNTLGIDWIDFGLSYDIKTMGYKNPSTTSIYFDYFERTKTTIEGDGNSLRSEVKEFGLGVQQRYYVAPNLGNGFKPYLGAGLGIYDMIGKRSDPDSYGDTYKTAVGAKVLIGTDIKGGVFVDGEYNWLPQPKVVGYRIPLNGYQVRLGYHF